MLDGGNILGKLLEELLPSDVLRQVRRVRDGHDAQQRARRVEQLQNRKDQRNDQDQNGYGKYEPQQGR